MPTVILVPKVRRESGSEGHEEPGHGLIEGRVVEDGAVAEVVHRVASVGLQEKRYIKYQAWIQDGHGVAIQTILESICVRGPLLFGLLINGVAHKICLSLMHSYEAVTK